MGSVSSWGEGASLALVSHPSSDGVTIKIADRLSEYNLEFQCSVRNLQKRALFVKVYPEMP